jgi:hypothetical protein
MTARQRAGSGAMSKRSGGKGLTLGKRTLRDLTDPGSSVRGGWIRQPISWSCPQPPPSSSNCPKTV